MSPRRGRPALAQERGETIWKHHALPLAAPAWSVSSWSRPNRGSPRGRSAADAGRAAPILAARVQQADRGAAGEVRCRRGRCEANLVRARSARRPRSAPGTPQARAVTFSLRRATCCHVYIRPRVADRENRTSPRKVAATYRSPQVGDHHAAAASTSLRCGQNAPGPLGRSSEQTPGLPRTPNGSSPARRAPRLSSAPGYGRAADPDRVRRS
jgi:hypothetical protein